MKYPKLATAIDELLSKAVKEHGEEMLEAGVELLMNLQTPPVPEPEKLPVVEFKQSEVRE